MTRRVPARDPARRGRPAKAGQGSRLSTWVPSEMLDRVVARALVERKSMSALLREIIERHFSS